MDRPRRLADERLHTCGDGKVLSGLSFEARHFHLNAVRGRWGDVLRCKCYIKAVASTPKGQIKRTKWQKDNTQGPKCGEVSARDTY